MRYIVALFLSFALIGYAAQTEWNQVRADELPEDLCDYEPGVTHSVISSRLDSDGNQIGQTVRLCSESTSLDSIREQLRGIDGLNDNNVEITGPFGFSSNIGLGSAGLGYDLPNGTSVNVSADIDNVYRMGLDTGVIAPYAEFGDVFGHEARYTGGVVLRANNSLSFSLSGDTIIRTYDETFAGKIGTKFKW